jgi:hypothetical protein
VPFKTFTASVLSSADMNTYLMKQAVITCTSGTRPASPVQGMTVYETDTNKYATYDGTAWLYLGGMIPYTPTLTNFSVGTGSVTARWGRIGDLINLRIYILGGTGATATGSLQISLPVAANATGSQVVNGRRFTGTVNNVIFAHIVASATSLLIYDNGGSAPLNSFGSGQEIVIEGMYERT